MYKQRKIHSKIAKLTNTGFSIECVPSRQTHNDAIELLNQLSQELVFVAITWHGQYDQSSFGESSSIHMARSILSCVQPTPDLLMHLTCVGQTKEGIKRILDELMQLGICNLLIVRGDQATNSATKAADGDFSTAFQLLSFVRSCYGNYFSIGVAGYPDKNSEQDWQCLTEKCLEADFIITQLFLQAESFIQFVARCRQRGINLPIIPGIMPIHSLDSFKFISRLTASPIPYEIMCAIKNLEEDEESIFNFGTETIVNICNSIRHKTSVIHFFSRNKKGHTILILKKLGFIC